MQKVSGPLVAAAVAALALTPGAVWAQAPSTPTATVMDRT